MQHTSKLKRHGMNHWMLRCATVAVATWIGAGIAVAADPATTQPAAAAAPINAAAGPLQFTLKDIDGKDVNLADYKGRVVMIVNVASKCGMTPQYKALEAAYRKYKDQGFVVLGFPANDFKGQEPGSDEEIKAFCTGKYDVTFPMFAKIDVNGSRAHPLFNHLKNAKSGLLGASIKWNFTKFLVDRSGKVVGRYAPTVTPEGMRKDIEALL